MPEETRRGIGTETVVEGDPATSDTLHVGQETAVSSPGVGPASASEGEPVRGDSIGRFLLLGVLGTGGMGHVYAAYDPHLDRKVAIKLLRADMMRGAAADARARLLREAQAMARINHPNVVKVHEVGTYEDQVYVAMEFADAGTLRAWLSNAHPLREIIDVFVQAGRGLAAAHAAGLVHRDFKPDNVLMGKDGSVRVTDFGLVGVAELPGAEVAPPAAALAPTEPRKAPDLAISGSAPLFESLTRTGSIMGTPSYMAPEQFSGAITTARADQFSFCVVLYEALYGARPFSGSNYQELASNVLLGQVSPPPRGARVPGWLRRALLRGLSVDPAARHASMDALLSELLRDRARRRRRLLAWTAGVVAAAAAAALALRPGDGAACDAGGDRVAGVWSSARRDQMKAAFLASGRPHAAASFDKLTHMLDAWGQSWELGYRDACRDTQVRREQSEHLLDLRMQCLTRRLEEADATIALLVAGGGDAVDHALGAALALPSAAPCGDAAALSAPVAPPETELARAQVQAVRGRLDEARGLERLARYAAALEVARAALAAARATGYRPVTAEALLVVGRIQVRLVDAAGVDALRESMHAATASGDAAGMVEAAAWTVFALTTQGSRHELAHEIAEHAEATAIHAGLKGESVVHLQNRIGLLYQRRGKPAEARARFEKALALAEQELGPDHPATISTLAPLGNLAFVEGRLADAQELLERVLASNEAAFGKDHPDVALALSNLGAVYQAEGKLDDAQRLKERALAIRIAALGPDHPAVGTSYNNLGTLHAERGDHATAGDYYAKALALWEKAYGPDNVQIALAASNLGGSLEKRGEYEQAAGHFTRAIALYEAAYGPEHPDLASPLGGLGVTRRRQHRLDEARALFQRATRISEKAYGPDHPEVADSLRDLAAVLKEQHKLDEARAMAARSLRIVEQAYGADHPVVAQGLVTLGEVQAEQNDHAGALATFQRSLAIFEASLGKDHLHLSDSLRGIGHSLVKLHRAGEAIPLLERALQIRTSVSAPPARLAELRSILAEALAVDPSTRARAIAEATTAFAEYEKAGDAAGAAEVRRWLDKHH